jgi:hypothetical protein
VKQSYLGDAVRTRLEVAQVLAITEADLNLISVHLPEQ